MGLCVALCCRQVQQVPSCLCSWRESRETVYIVSLNATGSSSMLGSGLSSANFSTIQPCCFASGHSFLGDSARSFTALSFSRKTDRFCGDTKRLKRASSGTSRCTLHFAQRCKPVYRTSFGGRQPVGAAGAVADTSIETIDAVETEALQFSNTLPSNSIEHTNAEVQQLSINLERQLQDLKQFVTVSMPSNRSNL